MRTPTESPGATKKTIVRLPSHSPRTKVASKSKALQGSESPQLSGLPKIPKSSVVKANLFRDLASNNHKQLEDRLSHKHLSSSLADIRASVDTKESTPNSQSPKKNNNSPKVNTKSMQEYYAKDEVKSPFEMSPKRSGYEKPRAKNVVGNKARNNRILGSLNETRSLSPVASSTALALRDEVRDDYGASPTLSSSPLKINLKMANTSTYKGDFVPYSLPEKDPVIKNDLYTAQHSGYVVGMDSTMKSEFKAWMSPSYVRHEAPKDTLKPDRNTFFGRTSYNTEYLNFNSHRTIIEKSPRHLTTFSDLAFAGKSSYRDTFNSSPEQREFVSRWFNKKDRSPFPGVPVPTQTTYSSTYKPFKVGSGIL